MLVPSVFFPPAGLSPDAAADVRALPVLAEVDRDDGKALPLQARGQPFFTLPDQAVFLVAMQQNDDRRVLGDDSLLAPAQRGNR